MSFYRAPFRNFVREQLEQRVDFLARGRGNEARPLKWYQQYLTKQAFVRVAPLVRIVKDDEKGINGLPDTPGFNGSTSFMKQFVLEGVPLKWNTNTKWNPERGLYEYPSAEGNIQSFSKMPQFPSKPTTGGNYDTLLNNPIIKTSPDSDGFGIVPPPGVTSCGVDTKSFYGNLREAKMSIRCFSIKQFEWIEKLYARPGHHVLLEWGWSHYIDNLSGEIVQQGGLVSDPGNPVFWNNSVNAGEIYREIEEKKKERSGNYDGFLGIIKNFQSKVETDGGFTLNVQLIGRGDLLESIPLYTKENLISGTSYSTIQFYRDDDSYIKENGELYAYRNDDEKKEEKDATSEWGKESHTNLVNFSHFLMDQPYDDVFNELTNPDERWVAGGGAEGYPWGDLKKLSKKSTIKTSTGSPGANYGFFTPKANIDTFILNDPYTGTYLNVEGDDKDQWDKRKLGAQEVGLGPFVRLGYLLKCVNYLGIDEDGVGKPAVTVNNLLYHKDFNPNEDPTASDFAKKGACNIYPSCYTNFMFEGTNSNTLDYSYNDFMTQLLNLYNQIYSVGLEGDKEFKKAYNDLPETKPINFKEGSQDVDRYFNDVQEKTEKAITSNEGLRDKLKFKNKAKKWREKIAEYYKGAFQPIYPGSAFSDVFKQATLSSRLMSYQIDKLADPEEDPGNYIYDLINFTLKNVGSCQPSKVLFPHQFERINRFKDWKTVPKGDNDINPYDKLYNLTICTERSKANKVWNSWMALLEGSYGKRNAQAIISNDGMASLSSHAMIDSLAILASHGKISKEYYDQLYTTYTGNLEGPHYTMWKRTNKQYNSRRVIDNIMISTHWLSKYLEDNEDKLTLGQFLKEICKVINEASGGSTDLKVVDNPVFPDQVSLVDFNVNSTSLGEASSEQFAFPKGGHTSIYKSLSITGKIPDAQAATIAIGAQGPRDSSNIESVTYAAFLEDIEDRISHPNGSSPSNQDKLIELQAKREEKYDKTFVRFFQNAIDIHLLYVCMNLDSGGSRKEWFTRLEDKAKRSASRMNRDIIYLSTHNPDGTPRDGGNLPISSIIPLKINIGMEGISGILASNTFKLDEGILPRKYNRHNVSYMVSKEKQTIKGSVWETSIEGSLVLDDNGATPKSTPPEIASTPKPKVETFDGSSSPIGRPNIYQASFDASTLEDTTLGDFIIPIDPNSKGKYSVSSVKAKRTGISGAQSSNHGGWDLVSSS